MTHLSRDDGAAPVDFVLVGVLLTLMFLGIAQLAIDYHVRNVLAACAAEGARYGANADVADPQAGAERANELITQSLGPSFAHAVPADPQDTVAGAPTVTVVVRARLPLLAWFLPAGPTVTATGHAFLEPG